MPRRTIWCGGRRWRGKPRSEVGGRKSEIGDGAAPDLRPLISDLSILRLTAGAGCVAMPADGSRRRAEQAADGPQEGGFTGPVGTDEGDDFAAIDRQRHAVQRRDRPVADQQVVDAEEHGGGIVPILAAPRRGELGRAARRQYGAAGSANKKSRSRAKSG